MILRTTKFFGFCYADEISEKEFFAKNFKVAHQQDVFMFSFTFLKSLDVKQIHKELNSYQFFEIEDVYLRNKLLAFIKLHSNVKKMKLEIGSFSSYIKRLKFTDKGFVIKLV